MTDPLAIQGNYADFKLVKTRSVVQMIIEVPIERAKEVVDAFGIPQPSSEIPVAVARINPALNKVQDRSTPARKPAATRAEKARRLCGVAKFQGFIFDYWPGTLPDGVLAGTPYEVTDYCVKSWCLVKSKSEFDTNPEAAKRWDHLLSEYEQATGRMAEKHG